MDIEILKLANEKSRNHLLNNGATEETRAAVKEDVAKHETAMTSFVEQWRKINDDSNLSWQGKQAQHLTLADLGISATSKLDKTNELEKNLHDMGATAINNVVTAADKYCSKDQTVKALNFQSFIASMAAQDQAGKVAHDNMVADAERNHIPLSDEQKAYVPESIKYFLEACGTGYTTDNAHYLQACLNPIFPARIVPELVAEHGRQILRQSTSPELHNQIEQATLRLQANNIIIEEIGKVLGNPGSYSMATGSPVIERIKSKLDQD